MAAELSQADLAVRCNLQGWDVSRETVAKIEAQIRWVADFELMCLAVALSVKVTDLLPPMPRGQINLNEWFSN
jgi:transcriptional regulator with XRE-family HTH domain